MPRVLWYAILLGCFGLPVAGCTGAGATSSSDPSPAKYAGDYPFEIVATTAMVGDIVRHVAGEHAQVVTLMGEGVDPHLFRPTRQDLNQLRSADLVFYSGLMLEGRMADTLTRVARSGQPVYAVTEGIDESYLREPPEFQGHFDPHVWMDVAAWSECVQFVADTLAEFDPPHAESYQANAKAYREQLRQLDEYARQAIATIPEQQRVLVTAHDAFGYFSEAYGIPVRSVQGLTTESSAGVNDINQLVDFIVENKLRAIFIESSVPRKNILAVIEGAAQRGWEVEVGGELFSDAMGPPGTYEGTYIGMIDHNITTIARALGGEAPERGFQGKLTLSDSGQ